MPPPTSAQIAAADVPCVVSKLRDGGRSDDGTMHVRSARDLWSWSNDDGSSAKTRPGVSQSPQVYQGRSALFFVNDASERADGEPI